MLQVSPWHLTPRPRVIGKGGATISGFHKKTGARIQVRLIDGVWVGERGWFLERGLGWGRGMVVWFLLMLFVVVVVVVE